MKWVHFFLGFLDGWGKPKPPPVLPPFNDDDLGEAAKDFYAFLDAMTPPDLILPEGALDQFDDVEVFDVYAVGGSTHWFVTDAPDSELSRKAHADWVDERNKNVFWQGLIDSQEGE